jgi:hypothetical protein
VAVSPYGCSFWLFPFTAALSGCFSLLLFFLAVSLYCRSFWLFFFTAVLSGFFSSRLLFRSCFFIIVLS